MDIISNTILQLFFYLVYVLVLSILVIWPPPPAPPSRVLIGFGFAVAVISSIYSTQSLLADHQFSSPAEFFSWLGQAREPVYSGKPVRYIGSGWNGVVCLYILAPAVVFAVRAFVRPRLKPRACQPDQPKAT